MLHRKWWHANALANQAPGIYADVNFHDEVAEAAGIGLGLMRRVGRNEQPIAGFDFESLRTDHRLAAVFAGDNAVVVLKILAVGYFPSDDHLAGTTGENIEIVGASVLFGVIENAVALGQAANRLISKYAIEHEHTEIASFHMYRSAPERLRAAAAGFFRQLGGFLGHLGVGFANVIDVPVGDGRSIGRERGFPGRIEAEGHNLGFVVLSVGAGDHREVIEVPVQNGLRSRFRSVSDNETEKCSGEQKYGKHSFHKTILRLRKTIPDSAISWQQVWPIRSEFP